MSSAGQAALRFRSFIVPLSAAATLAVFLLLVAHITHFALAAGDVISSPDPTFGGVDSSLTLDALGNPVVSYTAGDHPNRELRVLHCGNPSCTSGNVISSHSHGDTTHDTTSVALNSAGNPVVAYPGSVGGLNILRCGNPTCSAGNSIVVADSVGLTGFYGSLALDSNDYPVVSYLDASTMDLKILHCGSADCSSGNTVTSPDSAGLVGLGTSLSLDADGNPIVSYIDYGNKELKVLHCGDPNCNSDNVINTLDAVDHDGGYTAAYTTMSLDAGGNPVMAYLGNHGNLKVAHCGDPDCSSGNVISSLDASVWRSDNSHPALTLDSSGNPVISYGVHSELSFEYRVVHCGNPNCTSGNIINSTAIFNSTRYFLPATSMRLDGSGYPVVSYHNPDTHTLNVLHCGDPYCWPDADNDGDGIPDAQDNCPLEAPENGLDADSDGCTDTPEGLLELVEALDLTQSEGPLLRMLDDVRISLDKGHQVAALKKLGAFVHLVEAQSGKAMTHDESALLVTYAKNLITLLS